nr:DUF192 domain-containing protein [Anaerolineae bacterium]
MVGLLIRESDNSTLLTRVKWCSSFFCRLRGLMFRRRLRQGEGLLLVEQFESRSATAIHMMFMFFPIAVIWLDREFRVVDRRLAKPWHPVYVPAQPAKYTLETHPDLLDAVQEGDSLVFHENL